MRFVTGDATSPPVRPAVIAHVCNDAGRWGAGFVLALSRRWPEPERDYRNWHAGRGENDFALGAARLVPVEPGLWVANIIGQHGTQWTDQPPVCYPAVWQGLSAVSHWAARRGASVHMPRIGCGLAGGSWDVVGLLVDDALSRRGVPVTVYDWPPPAPVEGESA